MLVPRKMPGGTMSIGICTLTVVGLLVSVTLKGGREQACSSVHGLRKVLVGMGSTPPPPP